MPEGTNTNPDIKWDGKTWFVTLPVEDGKVLEAKSEPGLTYVDPHQATRHRPVLELRIRDPHSQLHLRRPEARYGIRSPGPSQERRRGGRATHLTMRTNPAGGSSNIVPFPRR